jgi:hypothetical protein
MRVLLPPLPWPPLIVGANVPAWVRVRDVVMTSIAWLLLCWTMRYGFALATDYMRPPTFEFTSMEPPNWTELVRRLSPFFDFIAGLLVWLLCWALVRGRAMRIAGPPPPVPPPLPLSEHAARFGLGEAEVQAWREAKVIVVDLAADGHGLRGEVRQAG